MKMKILAVLATLLMAQSAFALVGLYGSVDYSRQTIKLDTDGFDDPSGNGFGVTAGMKFLMLAGEAFYRMSDIDGSYDVTILGVQKTGDYNVKTSMYGFGLRYYPFPFINVKGGLVFSNTETSSAVSSSDESDNGMYLGAGISIPLPIIDVYADYQLNMFSDTDVHEILAGVRYYFF